MPADLATLRSLLLRRLEIIADHPWRDRDPEGHLAALAAASTAISAWHHQHRTEIPPRLAHFLTQASLAKALEWLDSQSHPQDPPS